ncbi:MAG: UbiA family prenyltransferase [Candidatus Heimdallarchaeota archaeon]|nr:UbiA family prenyltransferase [Candidatus Heimdallarchaeota archaeon]
MPIKKIISYIKLSGPAFKWFFGAVSFSAGYLIGCNSICNQNSLIALMIGAFIFGVLAQIGTRSINDYFDYDIDMAQNDDPFRYSRKLLDGSIRKTEALITGTNAYLIGIIALYIFINLTSSIMLLFLSLTSILYSKHLKKIFPLNTISINMIYGLFPLIAGYSLFGDFHNIPLILWIYLAIGFLVGIGSSNIKDITDIKGDKEYGVNNLATLFGARKTIILCTLSLILAHLVMDIFIYMQYLKFHLLSINILMIPITLYITPSLLTKKLKYRHALPIFAYHNIIFLMMIPVLTYLI